MQDNISILLQETSHPGNIGSAARAMKTMMLKHLMLIQPRVLPDAEAEAFASGAADILNNAIIKPNINDALSEFQVVFGLLTTEQQKQAETLTQQYWDDYVKPFIKNKR